MTQQQSEDRFHLLFDATADALVLHDLEGRFVEVNQAACDSLGYTREELLQQNVLDIEVGITPEAVTELRARILQGEKITWEGLSRRKDGTTFPVEVRLSPFEYEGRPHILASARDITERLRYEEALRTSESFLNSIIDQSPYPMWISDDQGTLIRLNRACLDLLHIKPEEVVGKYNVFQDNIVAEQGILPLLPRVFEKGETVRFELAYDTSRLKTFQLETSTSLILDVTVSPIKDGSGKITNAVFQHVDITARKKTEEALELSEKKYRSFYQSILDGFGRVDLAGNIVETNQGFLDMLGYTEEEIQGLRYQDITPLQWHEFEADIIFNQVIPRGYSDTYEKEYIRKDGTVFPVELRTYLSRDESGAPAGMWAFVRDITHRKLTEEALQKEKKLTEAILDSLPGTFFLLDSQGRHLLTNKSGIAVSGYSFAELANMHVLKTIANEDKPAVQRAINTVFAEGEASVEARILSKDGQKTPFLFTARKFIIDHMPCILGTGLDITARKKGEEALRESEERFRRLSEAAFEAIIIHEKGFLLSANDQYYEMFGYESGELLGKEALPLTVAPEVMESMRKEITAGSLGPYESIGLKKDGTKFPMEIRVREMEYAGRKARVAAIMDITERKRAEEALRESEKRFRYERSLLRALIDSIPDLISFKDQDSVYLGCNKAFEAYSGMEERELIGRNDLEIATREVAEFFRRKDREMLASGKAQRNEEWIPFKDGGGGYFDTLKTPYYGPDGELLGLIGVSRDITAQKEAEEALRISEVTYREIFNTVSETIWVHDIETWKFIDVNKNVTEMFGYAVEEALDLTMDDISSGVYPFVQEKAAELLHQAAAGEPQVFEWHCKHKDGHLFWSEVNLKRGTIAGRDVILALERDITARKQAEEALRESEKKYRSLYLEFQGILNAVPDILCLLSPDLQIVWGNDATVLQLPERQADEIIGKHCYPLRHERSEPCENCPVLRCFSSGKMETEEVVSFGEIYELRAVPLYDDQGELRGAIEVARNITERKRMEEALEKRLVALSRPLDETEDINFHDLFNLKDIQRIQDLFAESTGVASLITAPDGTPITQPSNFCRLCSSFIRQTEQGRQKCAASDAALGRHNPEGPTVHHCLSAGLCGAGASITVGGKHIANWLIGQVRDETVNEENLRDYARDLGLDPEEFLAAFLEVPAMPAEHFKQVAQALFVFANQLSAMAYHNVQQARFITERKQAEEQLLATQERLELALKGADLGTWDWDVKTGAVTFNNRWAEMLGYTLEEVEPHMHFWEKLVHPDDLPAVLEILNAHSEGQTPFYETEHRLRHKLGEWVWVLDKGKVIERDAQGKAVRACGTHLDITERKQMEESLARTQIGVDRARDAIHWVKVDGGLAYVNQAFCDCLGYSREELLSLSLFDIDPLLSREDWPERWRQSRDRGPHVFETLHKTKEGRIFPVEIAINFIIFGGQEYHCAFARDITERKEAEEALLQSEARFRQVVEFSPLPIGIGTEDGSIEYVNPKFVETFGYTLEDLPHLEDWFRLAYPDPVYRQNLLSKWQKAWKRIKEEGVTEVEEVEIACKDGSRRIMQFFGTLMGNKSLVVFNDLTERKQAEIALLTSERRLADIIDFLPDATFAIDLEGKVIAWNRAIEEMTGVPAAEIIGKGDYEYTLPFYGIRRPALINLVFMPDAEIEKKYAFVKKEGDILLAETKVHLKGGTQLVWAKARPLYNGEGKIIGAIEAIRDISERQRAEEERAKLEAQMREVQKLESLGVLAGGIAHDFNNLLMAILGNADLALHSLSPASPARPNVEEIAQASQRAADLCRQMLAYSGKGRFVVGRYDLSEIVREMAQMLKVSVSKQASLRYSFTADLPAVEADATQIRQIIMNLITNASEAIGEAGGIISISTGVMDCDRSYLADSHLDENLPEGRYVFLEVSDNGGGMDEETQRRIFDPFYTTKFTGRGLGLAAVLGIVRGHRGAIKVYSEPGQGTTFKVLLPAVAWEPGDRVKTAEPEVPPRYGGTVLLIDDDQDVCRVASEMLTRLGLKVITAAHGREGLEIFKTRAAEIDCVLLDLTMPEMGGEEAFRELRRLRRDVKVILSSGYNEQDVTQRFVGKGLAGFIQKPFTMAKLQVVLSQVFD